MLVYKVPLNQCSVLSRHKFRGTKTGDLNIQGQFIYGSIFMFSLKSVLRKTEKELQTACSHSQTEKLRPPFPNSFQGLCNNMVLALEFSVN